MKCFYTTLNVTTPPVSEPVSLTTAKTYCRVYTDFEDTVITTLITVARMMVEEYLSRSLMTQTLLWTLKLQHHVENPYSIGAIGFVNAGFGGFGFGAYPSGHNVLELPRAPVQMVNSINVLDAEGNTVALTDSGCCCAAIDTYTLDTALEPARLTIYWDEVSQLPSPPVYPLQHIQISLTTGYTLAIPAPIVQAILLMVNYLYENRGDTENPEMPKAIMYLLDQYRITYFGGTP